MMFVRLSVRLGRACIVIIRCTLVRISVYGWIVRCSGYPDTKACPPTPIRLFPIPPGREVGSQYCDMDVQLHVRVISPERLKTEVKLLLSANRKSYICLLYTSPSPRD